MSLLRSSIVIASLDELFFLAFTLTFALFVEVSVIVVTISFNSFLPFGVSSATFIASICVYRRTWSPKSETLGQFI